MEILIYSMSCKELYEILSKDCNTKNYKLTFAPNQSGIIDAFFILQEQTSIEVVCFKSTYLSIFKEAHDYFKNNRQITDNPKDWNTYYSSLGYLLTTPENKTNFNVHYDTFLELLSVSDTKDLLDRELRIIQRLLTSSNNRLNKSSSMWQMYRKLHILSVQYRKEIDHDYVETFLESGARHFSNYYCWSTARWFFDVLSITDKKSMIGRIKLFCLKNPKDSSSWNALAYMICQQRWKLDYNIENYYHLQGPKRDLKCHRRLEFEVTELFREIVHFIDLFEVAELPPFICCRVMTVTFPECSDVLLKKWESDIENFEVQYGTPKFIRKNPVPSPKHINDAVISVLSKHIGYKKRFIEQNL